MLLVGPGMFTSFIYLFFLFTLFTFLLIIIIQALYDLRNETSLIIKVADKGSVAVIRDKEDYFKEAEEQLCCKEMYEKITGDPSNQGVIPYRYYA